MGILLVVGYMTASVLEWQQYKDSRVDFAGPKQAVTQALKANQKSASQNITALASATDQLVSNKTVCNPAWWVAWQTMVPGVKNMVDACSATASKQATLKEELIKVNAFLADEKAVHTILEQVPSSSKTLTDKTWDAEIAKWDKVEADLTAYSASKEYEPVLVALQKQVGKVLKAWDQIKAADKKENKEAYEAAYNALDQATTGMVGAADTSDAALKPLLDKADAAAKKL